MRMDDLKKVIAKLIRENFHQSLSEATYDLGNKQYTNKNMTPTEILDLAMAYANVPGKGGTMYANKMTKMIFVANDLAKLTGTIQLNAKIRSKEPALILVLMKNKLISKEEYVELYKNLLAKQMVVIRNLKNADPASRMVGGAAARQAHKDMKGNFDESVNEMSKNDVHFKEIMKMYDKGGSFTKKKVAVVVCNNPRASRRDIEEELLDSDYNEITQYQDELQIAESVQGDKIQNLNNRIKALKDKISATKNSEQKSKFQNTLKNALQSLSNIRKAQTESVNEGKKAFKINPPIGSSKYSISAYDGIGKHKDGSPFWDILIFKNKADLERRANYFRSEKYIEEAVNEAASVEAMGIAALTGVRGDAVQKFIDDNNIHARKLLAYLKMKGPHTLSNRMDISTAIVGKANNKFAQGIIKAFSESKVNEAKFEVYHNSYTSAINAAREYAEKQGYTINDDDSFTKIGMGPRKPSEGKTNKFSIELSKDGKVQRKQLHIQVYGMKTKYELNCYIG